MGLLGNKAREDETILNLMIVYVARINPRSRNIMHYVSENLHHAKDKFMDQIVIDLYIWCVKKTVIVVA